MKIPDKVKGSIQKKKFTSVFIAGIISAFVFICASILIVEHTASPEFCMTCHEMRIVGEQGWEKSSHVNNNGGVAAECKDCHIPPGLVPMLWTKARDGSKDIFVHTFGESDPNKINWEEKGIVARKKIPDSSCLRCHKNLIPDGAEIKTIIAHREYIRFEGLKKCLDCHVKEFHGEFKDYLAASSK